MQIAETFVVAIKPLLTCLRMRGFLLLIFCAIPLHSGIAASFEFIAVESVFSSPPGAREIRPYAIVLASSRRRYNVMPAQYSRQLQEFFVFQTQVRVDGQIYYRLALGNFTNSKTARVALERVRKFYADAWIYKRDSSELRQLARFVSKTPKKQKPPAQPIAETKPQPAPPASGDSEQLLLLARQEFIDGNYARVIAITDKVTLTGNLEQVREALELAGITRERQRKFAQAIVLYEALLDTRPPADIASRVQGRLDGIVTMSEAPKTRIETDERETASEWSMRGVVQQFYQDDEIELSDEDPSAVNRTLNTDLDLYVQRRTDTDSLALHLDIGRVDDFLEDRFDSRVSEANIEYERDSFRIVGGRQYRSMTGIYSRFDGLTYRALGNPNFQYSFGLGYLVQSSLDGIENDHPFAGVNLDFGVGAWLDINLYLIDQEISDLTDRQAVGTEIRFQNESNFVFGTVDYDLFYEKLNNLSLVSNFVITQQWSMNLNLGQGYSPILSTINALQGQPVETIDELREIYTDDEIYQFAEDRTSKSEFIYIGNSLRFDATRQLYIDISSLKLDATVASGGVESAPASEDLDFSVEYSFQGLLFDKDYASIGLRLSDSTNSETTSVRVRTRFNTSRSLSFDPRLQLDHRKEKRSDQEQFIIKPSLKLKYRASRNLTFESTFTIEYSDLDLPEIDQQYTYSTYLGYYYLF